MIATCSTSWPLALVLCVGTVAINLLFMFAIAASVYGSKGPTK